MADARIGVPTIITLVVAILVASKIGPAVSDARNAAVVDLLGNCGNLLGASGPSVMGFFIGCGLAVLIFMAIPGTIGIFLLIWRGG